MTSRFIGVIAAVACASCSSPPDQTVTPPGPGVIFTFPTDGQKDVPTAARLVVTSSDPISGTPSSTCAVGAGGAVSGDVCVVGPEGVVAARVQVAGANNTVLLIQPSAPLDSGAKYSVYVQPSALNDGAVNLPASGPLFSFTTRSDVIKPGVEATVVSVNDDDPAAFQPGGPAPKVPFVDFMSVRVLFSEPLNDATAVQGQSVRFVEVQPGGGLTDVPGVLYVHDIHLTFDPSADLDPTRTYQLLLGPGLVDKGGEPLTTPLTFEFHPLATGDGGVSYSQTLAVTPPGPAAGAAGTPSALDGQPANTIDVHSTLIGSPVLSALPGAILSELADPSAFGGPIPLTIRKGQRIDLSSLAFQFGGVLAPQYQSGTMHMLFLTDANGVLRRNPYRSADTSPDDGRSPVTVDFTFDAALFSDDPVGDTLATQTLYAVHMSGAGSTDGSELAIDNIGAIEFNALGVTTAVGNVTFRLETNPSASPTSGSLPAPALLSSYPAQGQMDFPVAGEPILFFSQPVDMEGIRTMGGISLLDGSGAMLPASLRQDGSSLVITPQVQLAYGSSYSIAISGLVDFSQAAFPNATVTFQTETSSVASPTAPLLTAVSPGAPCALTGGTASMPGHCVGGQSGDPSYQPFQLAANQNVEARFSQPMLANAMVLGASCGQGSVRVEEWSGGTCMAPVPGTLLPLERGFTFVPASPWQVGQAYRLTLVAGSDPFCQSGGLCNAASPGRSLNSAPLNGIADTATVSQGGGPDVAIDFVGAPATTGTPMVQGTYPFADLNGNGLLDPGEVVADDNRLGLALSSVGGIINSATLLGSPCDASAPSGSTCQNLEQDLPLTVLPAVTSCPVDANGNPTSSGSPCVPVQLSPSTIQVTASSMNVSTLGGVINLSGVSTGMLLMRLIEPSAAGILGYIVHDPSTNDNRFVTTTQVLIDAPDMVLAGGLATHNLHSYPSSVTLKGPVTFLPDGRLQVATTNLSDVPLNVQISSLGLNGTLSLTVPAGQFRLSLVGAPVK